VPQCIHGEGHIRAPILEKITIPPYPFLARLAGMEGTVRLDVSLNNQCDITNMVIGDGESRLADAVERSMHGESTRLRFRTCTLPQAIIVHISFVFTLRGQPTNEWSATKVRITSEDEESIHVNISTTPGDLNELGLEKKEKPGEARSVKLTTSLALAETLSARIHTSIEPIHDSAQQIALADFTLPSYNGRSVRVQGDVRVEADVNSNCRVSSARVLEGHPLLNEEVLNSVREWHFSGCSGSEERVNALFHFSLMEPDSPSPLDNWAPTTCEMVGPYEFKIETVAPDAVIYN